MYIYVKLLSGLPTPLWYKVPTHFNAHTITVGTIVRVPLRTSFLPAYVLSFTHTCPATPFTIKDIQSIEQLPQDNFYIPFITQLAYLYNMVTHTFFISRLHQFLYTKDIDTPELLSTQHYSHQVPITCLTSEQQKVCDYMITILDKPKYAPTLLHGVTGSGKTEIYKKIICHTLSLGKTVILLLPEVTLAGAFEERLKQELGHTVTILGFHSGKTISQKEKLWHHLKEKNPILIIGVHLPILLPIANLGLIIVDEEHETGYQEKRHPKINSKHAALVRAHIANIPILLGSATPSIQTLYKVKTEKWAFFQLKERFGGSFPLIKTVLLTEHKERRHNFWITPLLHNAIADRIAKKEQTIIFLNRRGHSFFVQCATCSFIFNCPSCSVSLTLHENDVLMCHYCGYKKQLPLTCIGPKCNATHLLKKGIGTQQAVTILQKMFPTARIARADMDVTRKKKVWAALLSDFTAGNIDILVGTQTVTKGYHFPGVTLVGVLWADLSLHFPQFNAAEITLQQLIQVAGRAGRARNESMVIIQTMTHHTLFDSLNEIDYLKIYASEMQSRTALCYPPYYQLVEIELKHANESLLDRESHDIATYLYDKSHATNTIHILGPAKPLVHKIQNMYARTIFIKGSTLKEIVELFNVINKKQYKSKLFFTPLF